jgi:hypothetical protein
MVGFFEGFDSEWGIGWRLADLLPVHLHWNGREHAGSRDDFADQKADQVEKRIS